MSLYIRHWVALFIYCQYVTLAHLNGGIDLLPNYMRCCAYSNHSVLYPPLSIKLTPLSSLERQLLLTIAWTTVDVNRPALLIITV